MKKQKLNIGNHNKINRLIFNAKMIFELKKVSNAELNIIATTVNNELVRRKKKGIYK